MISRTMRKSDIKKLLRRLSREYTLIGPARKLDQYVFGELDAEAVPELSYPRTILPVKKYLFPDRETMFEFGKGKFKETLPQEGFAFFGLHICEINAIRRLDRAMQDDPYYEARRKHSFIVGVNCKPDDLCFCKSMKADKLPPGACDLFLTDAGDDYIVHAGTEKGRKMLSSSMFHRMEHPAPPVAADYQEKKHIDIDNVWNNFTKNHDNPLWDEMAKLCLGCANCTVTCPLCYCYDVADRTDVVPDNPRRERFWDSCTLLNFATVVPGHKFRPNIKDRYRNIYTHKFKSFVDGFDLPACVGCGRCTAYCPAGIKMLENLERLEVR
jgi:sulfhydrogenase subunit beta (sulfur reductase)